MRTACTAMRWCSTTTSLSNLRRFRTKLSTAPSTSSSLLLTRRVGTTSSVPLVEAHLDSPGYAKTYIILPSTIFGTPSNALTKAGIQNTHSIQLPFLIKASIGRGQGGVVGKGAAKWNYVSNADSEYQHSARLLTQCAHLSRLAAELFVVVFNGVTTPNNTVPHGREGLFIGENGVFAWSEVGNAIAKALYEAGKGKSPEATTFTSEELTKYFGSEVSACLLCARRARADDTFLSSSATSSLAATASAWLLARRHSAGRPRTRRRISSLA